MKFLRFCLVLIVFIQLNGCIASRALVKMPVLTACSSYAVGEELTRDLNTPMLSRVEATIFKAYVATKSIATNWGTIAKGSRWEALHFFENHDVLTSASYANRTLGFLVDYRGNPLPDKPLLNMGVLDKNIINRPLAGTYRYFCPNADGLFKALELGTVDPRFPVKREVLVYGGIVDGAILLYYLEYINTLSKPATHQTARYDLKAGDILTFNRFKIKVIRADKREIVFEPLE